MLIIYVFLLIILFFYHLFLCWVSTRLPFYIRKFCCCVRVPSSQYATKYQTLHDHHRLIKLAHTQHTQHNIHDTQTLTPDTHSHTHNINGNKYIFHRTYHMINMHASMNATHTQTQCSCTHRCAVGHQHRRPGKRTSISMKPATVAHYPTTTITRNRAAIWIALMRGRCRSIQWIILSQAQINNNNRNTCIRSTRAHLMAIIKHLLSMTCTNSSYNINTRTTVKSTRWPISIPMAIRKRKRNRYRALNRMAPIARI